MATESEPTAPLNPSLLARYLSGEADRDECVLVERWIAANAEHRVIADTMRAVWDRPPVAEFDSDDAVWQRLKADISAPASNVDLVRASEAPARSFQAGRRLRRSWLAAAVAVLTVGTAVSTWWSFSSQTTGAVVGSHAYREISTQRGERLALRLADGTRVVLAPESRLRLGEGLGAHARGPREVHLAGEAFFEVVHNSARPFLVHTPTAIAEDLGTEFVVTSYPETQGTRVVVASGVVELQAVTRNDRNPPTVTLKPGSLGFASPERPLVLEQGIDVRPYVAWTDGTLEFDGTPLREAVATLRRWYDVDIQLGRADLAEVKLSATFRDEPLTEVLSLIAMSLDLTVERRGASITLR